MPRSLPARLASAALVLGLSAMATLVACHRIGRCEPMDVNGFKTTCSGPAGFSWNGATCVYTHACGCTGDDCQGLYRDRENCETAHTHCVH